jgi:hypothetical protein
VFLEVYPQVLGVSTLKRCTKCKEYKEKAEFGSDISRKDGINPTCRQCVNTQSRKYNAEHPDRRRNASRNWRENNREYVREYQRVHQMNTKPERAAYLRKWRLKHGDHDATYHIKGQLRTALYRSRKANASGVHTADDLIAIRAAQTDKRGRLRCWWCGKSIIDTPHLDHKMPLARGGSNGSENLCYSCGPCNCSKSAKTPAEYAGRLI